ncbi:MAG: (E)-4-hydroxy-3-methylbut-2-enyl-diphosphate synthase, partial [Paludibacteraceae bacterium]|nr:(E)-4-hydroxy-3-methylbut-2-enyl-diphosphate synthase [Paludibacteraceae bacterium]
MITRRKSKEIQVGNLRIGGNNPIRIQTMANTDTNDIEASVAQAKRCLQAGTELLRYTTQGTKEAENLGKIKNALRAEGIDLPLVADIHFNANVAEVAAQLVEKVRINPGNFVTGKQGDYTDEEWDDELRRIREKLHTLLSLCKDKGTTIRIGVNHGSLSPRIMSRYGNTPLGLATSCMEFIDLCEQEGFTNLILSVKASNTRVMIYAVRLLVQMMDAKGKNYPLHLGVTEAGSDDEGRIKSAIGIGTLLHDGIGDTIRVSLSEAPEAEIPVARKLVDYIEQQRIHSSFLIPHSSLKTEYSRRKTTPINNIGGNNPVIVVADTKLNT